MVATNISLSHHIPHSSTSLPRPQLICSVKSHKDDRNTGLYRGFTQAHQVSV